VIVEAINELEAELAGWPSFRELAERLGVNPTVLQDDLDELLERGLIETNLLGIGLRVYHVRDEPAPHGPLSRRPAPALGPRLRPGPLAA
jgi:DNA-binding IclR family transcriptional regulator